MRAAATPAGGGASVPQAPAYQSNDIYRVNNGSDPAFDYVPACAAEYDANGLEYAEHSGYKQLAATPDYGGDAQ